MSALRGKMTLHPPLLLWESYQDLGKQIILKILKQGRSKQFGAFAKTNFTDRHLLVSEK